MVKVIPTQQTDISAVCIRCGGARGAEALKEEWQPGVEVMSPACFLTNNTGDVLNEVMLATDHNLEWHSLYRKHSLSTHQYFL